MADGTGTAYQVLDSTERFANKVFRLVSDTVTMPGGGSAVRDYLRHVGAVGAVALDDTGRVLLIRQYRHPVGEWMWELPAGLTDVPGEPPLETARRELAEEADVAAGRWDLLVDLNTSPGCTDERIRLYLARDVSDVPVADRHVRTDEEADLSSTWFDLDEAVDMAFTGRITNAACVAGVLAAARARDSDWRTLRPASDD